MEIIINGKQAYLKKNTSFEYISENPLFTGSDSYTLSITFPLKDCPQNIRIFGHLHRQDVLKNKVVFDCDIRDKGFFKSGSIIITQISEVEVKSQFLEGRSEQNFNETFDDIFLNELDLGYPDASERNASGQSPSSLWNNNYPAKKWVPLPWVNNTSGNMQNAVVKNVGGSFSWNSNTSVLTFQPFLLYILNKICQVIGYTGYFESIMRSKFRYLIICNTLPSAWGIWNFAVALPHWSLTEFFEELEKLMHGEFSINYKARTISFEFSHITAHKTQDIHIRKVFNKYQVEVSRENKSEYVGATNMEYADNGSRMWAYRSCQWYIDEHKDEALVYSHLSDLLNYVRTKKECGISYWSNGRSSRTRYTRGYPNSDDAHGIFYAKDVDTYFIMWCIKAELVKTVESHSTLHSGTYNYYKYTNRLMPINQFGKLEIDREAEDTELNIVPAWIDDTDSELGQCLFLECGEMGSAISWTEETDEQGNTTGDVTDTGGNSDGGRRSRGNATSYIYSNDVDEEDYNNGALAQTRAGKSIAKGEKEKNDAYFDKIYVGFWNGNHMSSWLPQPITDVVEVHDDFTVSLFSYSLRLNRTNEVDDNGVPLKYTYKIDNKKKYNFSFLSDEIPNPRALFYIEGSKYVCEKITATFHENTGKSQLLKGVFYRVLE